MAGQVVERSGLPGIADQPRVLGVTRDQAALLRQPIERSALRSSNAWRPAVCGAGTGWNTSGEVPSLRYAPSPKIMCRCTYFGLRVPRVTVLASRRDTSGDQFGDFRGLQHP